MNYRFYLTILSSRVEVFPTNFLKTSLGDKKDSGKAFYRRKFNGTLRFYCNTKTGTSDFELLYLVEQADNCTDLILEIEQKDSAANTYHNYWTGHFSTTDGVWDLDNSTFDVTPLPYDDYTDFDLYGDKEYNIIYGIVTTVTVKTLDEDYPRNRWVVDVIRYLLTNIYPAATMVSNFLENDYNPVTLDINKYKYLTIAQKSDIKRPVPPFTNPATIGMLSFNQLMEILKMYNLRWVFDGSVLRIEHVSYWTSGAGLDLRSQIISKAANKYSYNRNDRYRYEKFSFMEWGKNGDYMQFVLSYSSLCTDDSTYEYNVEVTTDIDYIYKCANSVGDYDPSLIDDNGWVILASYPSGANYLVYSGFAYDSTLASHNYVNSWSYLIRNYFRHERVMINGFINGLPINFISAIKNKIQPIKAIVCYEDNYDPNDYITTELGEEWFLSQKGYVQDATIHPDGHVDFNLVYGEDTGETPTPVPTVKTVHCVINLASENNKIYTYLSEPSLEDIYYVVLFDDGLGTEECYEITIPAGIVYQVDTTVSVHTVVDGIYTQDPSLHDDWEFYYNDNEPWPEMMDCGAGPPPPPPDPPDATVISSVTQSAKWEPVIITWTAKATTTYYEVWRKPDWGFSNVYDVIALVPSTNTSYTDYDGESLDHEDETWCYKIKACNAAGCSADSAEQCINVNP